MDPAINKNKLQKNKKKHYQSMIIKRKLNLNSAIICLLVINVATAASIPE